MKIERESFCAFLRYMEKINRHDIRDIDFSELLGGQDLPAQDKEGIKIFYGDVPTISLILEAVIPDKIETLLKTY